METQRDNKIPCLCVSVVKKDLCQFISTIFLSPKPNPA